jgi:uncharacterized protein (DUF2062 family)
MQALRDRRAWAWLGPIAEKECLWRFDRGTVARGAAIGAFVGIALPVAQIVVAALIALLLRANLPIAAALTFISNPFTVVPLLWLAHLVGSTVTGLEAGALPLPGGDIGWLEWLREAGLSVAAGLGVLATGAAALAYAGVAIGWRLRAWWRMRRRHADDRGDVSV